ncbi:uncharacterized protein BDZ99DRAFT_558425 [Mytilinidion resinicola]|uniref:TPR domain-containing protein n=1 Tax=Mytilinidion resinicola TaxID=574789 RepID=A0A6A6YU10_9PEZI|nr:uncharacterized protein BDZ99DRAFT_558425 [Mytilinidion resinicola]KAF2812446.1 hypothetical protein BDZ99DRAFT_558425 [Mytilinidion resinicola]
MFSRRLPRASQRACSRLSQPPHHPLQTFAKLPSQTRIPRPQCLARRNISTAAAAKKLFKESPFLFPLAGFCIIAGMAGFLYLPYYYQNYIIAPYHNFPEPVAKKLRRAIFYSSGRNVDVREANKYFRQGILLANELGMDPFSDEILGVKIAIAAMFEREQHFNLAIEVLEILRRDCYRWVEEVGPKHWTDGKRTKILSKTVELNVKLGELYSNKYVQDTDAAEERLVEAVETILKEKSRREKDGVQTGEGEWMSDEEVGASLEALGHHYEEKDLHYLATPLFLQALTLCPPKSCHSVVLMNNLSICLAQQTPTPTPDALPNSVPHIPPHSRAMIIDQARQWASKALASAAVITPPDRTEECDQGCAVATHNLGEFAEMEGKIQEARKRYQEAASLAKAVGFKEGEINAKEGLKRLKGKD